MHYKSITFLLCIALTSTYGEQSKGKQYKKNLETPIEAIRLAKPLDKAAAEISGLAWCQGNLILLPQYPEFNSKDQLTPAIKNLYQLNKEQIENYLATPNHEPLNAQAITLNEQGIRELLTDFEGYEAIACNNKEMWLSIEMNGANNMFGSHMVAAKYKAHGIHPSITLLPNTLKQAKGPTQIVNSGYESMLLSDDKLVSIYEINQYKNAETTSGVSALWQSIKDDSHGTIDFTEIPYRLTDVSGLDDQKRFWAINYLWPGDAKLAQNHDTLVSNSERGQTHLALPQVERLLEFKIDGEKIVKTDTPAIQLVLSDDGGRNWEGLARFDNRGFLIATDKHPNTQLAFVPRTEENAGSVSSKLNKSNTLRIATFNVSVEANNYSSDVAGLEKSKRVENVLKTNSHPQLRNIAEIIQRVRPDILLLNEFDFIADPQAGILNFVRNYLNQAQNQSESIEYPFAYIAPVNTGLASPYDLDKDGKINSTKGDAWGYGEYPGHYGMAVLSRFPIDTKNARTFQNFLWKDMPKALAPKLEDGSDWYSHDEWQNFRLSSKSHWDLPIKTPNGTIHVLASHPTPPTFDGKEDRNGKRNHDEIRFISDYINKQKYMYDDLGNFGGLGASDDKNTNKERRFAILGDLNASATQGDSIPNAIQQLLNDSKVNNTCQPTSQAGQAARVNDPNSASHTAAWGLQVDYVLVSVAGLSVEDCGVFWPAKTDPLHRLVKDRSSSSDHRLIWIEVEIKDIEP